MERLSSSNWTIHAEAKPEVEARCGAWIRKRHLQIYGHAHHIECPDLYGPGWIDAVVGLYETGIWDFSDNDRRGGYSVVVFGPHGERYRHPPRIFIEAIKRTPGVSSVHTFHEDLALELHAMPPGGFRLAVVNGFDLAAACSARVHEPFRRPPQYRRGREHPPKRPSRSSNKLNCVSSRIMPVDSLLRAASWSAE
jgi:hypothetical protein